ncbi:ABC transporter substrate-binding protein [Rhodoluna sp.]|uniref:ABC transporter substrate-binding protein n=1 Tax=Rhodoluna sp. TaxID=1969481 RepID=UPI0025F7BE02|nr:ABC transporter substrate-binding protein [Rhodoluna sp.]
MSISKVAGLAMLATASLFALAGCAAEPAPSASPTSASTIAVDEAAAALVPAEFKDGISIASDIPYAPMELFDENDNPTGFDYDLSQAIGAKLGVKMSFEDQDWDGIIPSLQSGAHDVIMSGMNDTAERQKVLDFVDYFKAGFAIIVAKGNPEGVASLADLCGKTVAIQTSTAQIDLINAVNPSCSKKIEILEFPTDGDAQNAIRAGKAVAGVNDGQVAAYTAQTAGAGEYFEIVAPSDPPAGFESAFTGVGVLKANSGLTAAIQAAIQSLIDDGTYANLLAKWNLSAFAVTEATINGTK